MKRRIKGKVKVQFYAIFISPGIPDNEKWQHALEQIDAFYNEVLTMDKMVHIKKLSDIKNLKEDEYGAVLTLEGADAFGNDLMKLRTRSEEHTSELQSRFDLVCRLLLEKKNNIIL